ncbi:MAG: methyltransferase domain-containing protein [Planctomycetota bacterium]|nr:methyltransferase domain-containing protein [Planctomycetota bacterium]
MTHVESPHDLKKPELPRYDLRLPKKAEDLDQDQEWCEVQIDGEWRRFRFHDYDEIYRVPGLYEQIFYERLKCASPKRVVGLLDDALHENESSPKSIRALDVGAGNGIVGEELKDIGVPEIVGVDLIQEAADAAHRDRPGVYDDYHAVDLTAMPGEVRASLEARKFNLLTIVAALGFNDIPPQAFAEGFNLVENGGWVAFNIKEDFITDDDTAGFERLVRHMMRRKYISMQAYSRYRHRLNTAGERLYYVAIVARKDHDIDPEFLEEMAAAAR